MALLLSLTVISVACATSIAKHFPYEACAVTMTGGRMLHDPGKVVGEEFDGAGSRVYLFVSKRNPNDGRHVDRVTRVVRACPELSPFAVTQE